MSLIAIIADTHLGVSNSNNMFLKYQGNYFKNLVDKLSKLGVTDLIHAGDLYDVRKAINIKTLRETSHFFREMMMEAPFNVHIIVGNHDSYNKNTLKINAPNELLGWTDFFIYQEPQEVVIGNCKILMMPWICADNEEKSYRLLEQSFSDVCIGHFDIAGFGMSKEVINQSGISRFIFKKFKHTFSGHFHLPSEQDNIIYVGSPYQLTWSDYGDIKRVILYDTETFSMSLMENDDNIFEKIHYSDGLKIEEIYEHKIIKIYAQENYDAYKFDNFVKKIQDQNPYSISIIDSIGGTSIEELRGANMIKDTMEFLVECVDEIDASGSERDEVKALMLKLYSKAQELK